jgi:uncharacterized protein
VKGLFQYFWFSGLWTLVSFGVALCLMPSWSVVYTLTILAVLEISLSFDNSIINAEILSTLSHRWRQRFLYIGIPTAVFGTRFVLPILLLWVTSSGSLATVWHQVIYDPVGYGKMLHESYPAISGFGSAFLLMVWADFFVVHPAPYTWWSWLESSRLFGWLRRKPWVVWGVILIIGLSFGLGVHSWMLVMAFLIGMLLQSGLSALHHRMGKTSVATFAQKGLIAFLYLELLDASFSLDGVVGAFTLTSNLWLMMLGLGIGAIFVRSLTVLFLERGILKQWRFLSHGAHYSIGALGVIMLLKNVTHVPETLVGVIMIGSVTWAVISSRE